MPSFDGWLRNADGTFTMVFGYMNRNYKEELAIPAGPDNKVEPGQRGSGPADLLPAAAPAWVFQVRVPADWSEQGTGLDDHFPRTHGKSLCDASDGGRDHSAADYDPGQLNPGLAIGSQQTSVDFDPSGSGRRREQSGPVNRNGHRRWLPKPRPPKVVVRASQVRKAQTNRPAHVAVAALMSLDPVPRASESHFRKTGTGNCG